MEYSSKTKQALLTIIVLVIVVSVAYVALFLQIKEKNNNISALTNEVDVTLQKEIKLRSIKYLIKDTLKERAELDLHFVADDEIINFIEMVESTGINSGIKVEITNVSISSEAVEAVGKDELSESLNLDLKIKGSFAQIFHFLSMLEKLPFKIDMRRVNFEKISDKVRLIDKSTEPWKGFFSITAIKLK